MNTMPLALALLIVIVGIIAAPIVLDDLRAYLRRRRYVLVWKGDAGENQWSAHHEPSDTHLVITACEDSYEVEASIGYLREARGPFPDEDDDSDIEITYHPTRDAAVGHCERLVVTLPPIGASA